MAFVPVPGKPGQFRDTVTGEVIYAQAMQPLAGQWLSSMSVGLGTMPPWIAPTIGDGQTVAASEAPQKPPSPQPKPEPAVAAKPPAPAPRGSNLDYTEPGEVKLPEEYRRRLDFDDE